MTIDNFDPGQIPISQQMAMMAQQQQQQQQHQQMLQQQHQASMPQQQAPMPLQQQPQQPPPQQQTAHVNHVTPAAAKVQKKRRRKDPNSPKRAMSAYFMFVQKERQEMEKRGEKISKVGYFYSFTKLCGSLRCYCDIYGHRFIVLFVGKMLNSCVYLHNVQIFAYANHCSCSINDCSTVTINHRH